MSTSSCVSALSFSGLEDRLASGEAVELIDRADASDPWEWPVIDGEIRAWVDRLIERKKREAKL